MANQFVYSSSPHNLDGNSGWGILTKTSDLHLDGDQLRQMQDFVVEPYSGNDAEDVAKPRQSFSFFKANGCWLLECSTATGKRWYLGDNRGGEYVAHVYVFYALEDDFSPFAYLNSDGFWREIPPKWKEEAKEISMRDSASGEKRSGMKRAQTLQYGLFMSLPGIGLLLLKNLLNNFINLTS